MAVPFLVNIDLGGNQILNVVVQGVTSDPSPAKAGQIIYRTDLQELKVCTNATGPVWTVIGTGAGTVTQVSVSTANGSAGSVSSSTTVPAITISLNGNPSGLLVGNGSDGLATATSSTVPSGTLKGNGSGGMSVAAAGTDYVTPSGSGAGLTGITESQVSGLTSDLAAKAPLASPTFTGTPAAPTASGGTNTTQLATTAFVAAAITGLPESNITNLTSDLAAKAPLASPTLTGTPAAPTASAGTNTTQIATTAYVTAAVSAAVQGLVVKQSVVAATTGAETYTITSGSVMTIAGTAIDGVSPNIGDRILIKDAPAASGGGSAGSSTNPNGVYTVTANTTNLSVSRAADFSGTTNLPAGAFTFVEGGTANDNNGYVVATPNTNTGFTYGSNPIQWVQFSGAGEVIAGTGLSKSGNTLSVVNPLNQNTTGTAANVTGTVALANGGTGQTGAQAAINALHGGTVTAGTFARGNGSNIVMAALQAADVPNNAAVAPASGKFAQIYNSGQFGDGSTTAFTFTHGLNNLFPVVQVWQDYVTAGILVVADVESISASQITVTFATAPASNSMRCVVTG